MNTNMRSEQPYGVITLETFDVEGEDIWSQRMKIHRTKEILETPNEVCRPALKRRTKKLKTR